MSHSFASQREESATRCDGAVTNWTPDRLDELAAAMIPVAADLTCAVRDLDRDRIERLIVGLDPMSTRALLVVLSAMVPDRAALDDLIAWTRNLPDIAEPDGDATEARIRRFIMLRDSGLSVIDAGRRLGVHRNTANRYEQLRKKGTAA